MNKKLEDTKKAHAAVSGYSAELGDRIAKVIALIGTQKDAARIAGVTDEQLGRWKMGKSRASFVGVAALARASGVNLNWLASGAGEMMLESHARAPVSRECLAAALKGIEAMEQAHGGPIGFEKKLDLILNIYASIKGDP